MLRMGRCAYICRLRRCTGVEMVGWSGTTFSIFCGKRVKLDVRRREVGDGETHQVLKHTLVQAPLGRTALP